MFATEIASSSASRIFTGGMMLGGAIDAMADNAQIWRAEAASSVQELALRLQESRASELAAIELAAALQEQLAEARAETARLRAQVAAEREGRAVAQAAFQELYEMATRR
jgi:hypothetical protein